MAVSYGTQEHSSKPTFLKVSNGGSPKSYPASGEAERYECTCSYKDRLKKLKLYSLERRRESDTSSSCFLKVAIEYVVNPGLLVEIDKIGRWRWELTQTPCTVDYQEAISYYCHMVEVTLNILNGCFFVCYCSGSPAVIVL